MQVVDNGHSNLSTSIFYSHNKNKVSLPGPLWFPIPLYDNLPLHLAEERATGLEIPPVSVHLCVKIKPRSREALTRGSVDYTNQDFKNSSA